MSMFVFAQRDMAGERVKDKGGQYTSKETQKRDEKSFRGFSNFRKITQVFVSQKAQGRYLLRNPKALFSFQPVKRKWCIIRGGCRKWNQEC